MEAVTAKAAEKLVSVAISRNIEGGKCGDGGVEKVRGCCGRSSSTNSLWKRKLSLGRRKIVAMARVVVLAETWKRATAQAVTSAGRVDSAVSTCSSFLVESKPVTVGVCCKAEVTIA